MLMHSFDDVVTDRTISLVDVEKMLATNDSTRRYHGKYWLNATGGTTGRRGLFLFDRDEWIWVIASYSRSYLWGGVSPNFIRRTRMAVVSTTSPWHQSAQVGQTVQSRWVPTLRLDATDPLGTIVERLHAWRPQTLVAYASMARSLAEEQLAGRLRIAPTTVFTASEVLTDAMRRRIVEAWGIEPFNVYGATETSTIASECQEHCGLHLFEDLVITESVDDHDRPVPPGTVGAKVLVTVLFNRTLPLIRYQMSDSISIIDEPCSCGLPYRRIGTIEGRREDILILPSRDNSMVSIHPNIFHDVLDNVPVDAWQVVQRGSAIIVRLVGDRGKVSEEAVTAGISHGLQEAGAITDSLSVEFVPKIVRTTIGKTPLVIREEA
jgi:phenylacetate-coenzyme A ligase PaaK-like adenylate-forming protein